MPPDCRLSAMNYRTKKRKPRPHQTEALAYAADRERIALLMQMRLGKTLVAIRWANKRAAWDDYVLVITPATTIHVWERELELEGVQAVALAGSTKTKLRALDAELLHPRPRRWFVTNPEGLRACPSLCDARPWSVVIADETGGWLTNPQAQITKILRRKLTNVPSKAILTGLPDPGGPDDYVSQMLFVFGEFMGCRDYWTWRKRYMYQAGFEWLLKTGIRRELRQAVKRLAFVKTTKQAGLFVPKVYETRYVEMSPRLRSIYRQVNKDFECGAGETKWSVVIQGWLAQLSGGIVPPEYEDGRLLNSQNKANELVTLLRGELRGRRVIVWARYSREIALVARRLAQEGLPARKITGLTPRVRRATLMDSFRAGEFNTLIIQSQIGQYALNLSCADAMVFYSNAWNWGIRGQCEHRADDMAKTEPVLIVDLVTRGTVDEAVLDTLKERKRSTSYFLQRVMVRSRRGGLV